MGQYSTNTLTFEIGNIKKDGTKVGPYGTGTVDVSDNIIMSSTQVYNGCMPQRMQGSYICDSDNGGTNSVTVKFTNYNNDTASKTISYNCPKNEYVYTLQFMFNTSMIQFDCDNRTRAIGFYSYYTKNGQSTKYLAEPSINIYNTSLFSKSETKSDSEIYYYYFNVEALSTNEGTYTSKMTVSNNGLQKTFILHDNNIEDANIKEIVEYYLYVSDNALEFSGTTSMQDTSKGINLISTHNGEYMDPTVVIKPSSYFTYSIREPLTKDDVTGNYYRLIVTPEKQTKVGTYKSSMSIKLGDKSASVNLSNIVKAATIITLNIIYANDDVLDRSTSATVYLKSSDTVIPISNYESTITIEYNDTSIYGGTNRSGEMAISRTNKSSTEMTITPTSWFRYVANNKSPAPSPVEDNFGVQRQTTDTFGKQMEGVIGETVDGTTVNYICAGMISVTYNGKLYECAFNFNYVVNN